jgi:hypothetical protein
VLDKELADSIEKESDARELVRLLPGEEEAAELVLILAILGAKGVVVVLLDEVVVLLNIVRFSLLGLIN